MNVEAWRHWVHGKNVLSLNAAAGPKDPLQVAFDSRSLSNPIFIPTLFVALKGVSLNGHDFIEEAHAAGVRFFLVEEGMPIPDLPDSDVVAVPHVIHAWQSIAFDWRTQWGKPIIAIAGSNGKTTVKEWLTTLLAPAVHVHSSPRSYNSQIGVPVSLWDLQQSHSISLIEAGVSIPGEMQRHAQTIDPNFGVLTHLGTSPLDSFKDANHLLDETLQLFESCRWVAMPDTLVGAKHKLTQQRCRIITWGTSEGNDLSVNSLPTESGRVIRATWGGVAYDWVLPFTSEIGFRNAMTAALVALEWGIDGNQIGASLLHIQDLDMRMQRLRSRSGTWVLSDAYTNDWDTLALALHDLEQLTGPYLKSAIIGPIPGMSQTEPQRLLKVIKSSSIKNLWLIGPDWESQLTAPFPKSLQITRFSSTNMALSELQKQPDLFLKQHVLVKGSRIEKFERFHPLLVQRGRMTQLHLDLEAVEYNLRTFKEHIQKNTGTDAAVLAVIKASGYGTNAPAMARLLQFNGVDLMAVACTEEGVELRQHGLSVRILVLNPDPDTFSTLLQYRLEPGLHSLEQLETFSQFLETSFESRPWPVHIKIDTGMHRLGFDPEALSKLRDHLDANNKLQVKSVFSHLASAENPTQDARTMDQFETFQNAVEFLRQPSRSFKTHILNTAGLIRFPEFAGNYVRIGIGLFGVRVAEVPSNWELKPAIQFTSVISTIHEINAGDGVGYGMTDISDSFRRVATLPVGYADGFPRHLSHGKGQVAIHGQLAPVVGKVCMDMVMVDVTKIENAKPGDSVELFGKTISVESFANAAGTIPYEVLTRIPARVHRTQSGN